MATLTFVKKLIAISFISSGFSSDTACVVLGKMQSWLALT
jgi:hypothetical protein